MRPTDLIKRLLQVRPRRIAPDALPVEFRMPEFDGLSGWLNSEPLTVESLRGKVTLVDFWTLSCVNCLRTLPHLASWYRNYRDAGFEIVGVHTPEFEFEKKRANVEAAVARHGVDWPVALDSDYRLWHAYRNRYWPSHYFVDAEGRVRWHHFGEGGYDHSEEIIRTLLAEAGAELPGHAEPPDVPRPNLKQVGTPETYLGFERLEYLGSPQKVREGLARKFTLVDRPARNVFYLEGRWLIEREWASPQEPGASLVFPVSASRVNLVMDGVGEGRRVEVQLDGASVREDELGADTRIADDRSMVTVSEGRMYELVDTRGRYAELFMRLDFPDPGVRLYAFTFG